MKRIIYRVAIAFAMIFVTGAALAQAWPNKPIRIVIGFPPGTIIDATARFITSEMEKRLGQPFVLEFKPGANSTIAAKMVVTASPDGYTLLYGTPLGFHPLFTRNNAVDASKELVHVSNLISSPIFFLTSAKLPVRNFDELLKFGKANPDRLTHGTSVELQDLYMAVLRDRTGLASRSIPFKGSSQTVLAVLAGDVDIATGTLQSYIPHLRQGTVRGMFVAAKSRHPLFPDLPTAAEVGIPNMVLSVDFGLWAPPGTPNDIVQKLSAEAGRATKLPAIADQIRQLGGEPIGSTAEEYVRMFEADVKFYGDAIRQTNFTLK